jgi:hypothetical protein
MRINVRRGLLRLWLVSAVLWVLVVGAVSFTEVRDEFVKARQMRLPAGAVWDVPVECGQARGSGSDYRVDRNTCWYGMPKFRAWYPEYKDLTDDELARKLYEKAGTDFPMARPWQMLGGRAAMALGLPIIVFVVGWAIMWALAGFTVQKEMGGVPKE